MVKKAETVPRERLHKKKSETVDTDLVAAAEPMNKGIAANIRIMMMLMLDCTTSSSVDIDIKLRCMDIKPHVSFRFNIWYYYIISDKFSG